jgi:hypothetical protein
MGETTARKRRYDSQYYMANREKIAVQQRRYARANPEKSRERSRRYAQAHPDAAKASSRRYRAALRAAVFDHYGWSCTCCGSRRQPTVDHRNGNGGRHRTELFGGHQGGSTTRFYRWLKNNGFPDDFQTLCLTCNTSKGDRPRCLINHQKRTTAILRLDNPDREQVATYLDDAIRGWRRTRDEISDDSTYTQARDYVNAYQQVRVALLGEILDPDDRDLPLRLL